MEQVEHPDFISFALQVAAFRAEQLSLRVCDKEGRICLQQVRLNIKARFASAGAAYNEDVQVMPVLISVKADPEVFC